MTIELTRDGTPVTVQAKPMVLDRPVYDELGRPTTDDAGKVITERAGLGTSGTPEIVQQPVSAVPGLIWEQVSRTAGVVLRTPEKMVGVAEAAFGSGERDPEGGPISVGGVGRVAGEVANADTSGIEGGAMAKFVTLIGLIAS